MNTNTSVRITITGRLAADPQPMRFTNGGTPVTNIRLLHTPHAFDFATKRHVTGQTVAFNVALFGDLAETNHGTLRRGDLVTVTGARIEADAFINGDGEAAASIKVTAYAAQLVAPSQRNATADEAELAKQLADADQ